MASPELGRLRDSRRPARTTPNVRAWRQRSAVGSQRALDHGQADVGQVAVQQRQDQLALGIAEAAVEFEDLRAVAA